MIQSLATRFQKSIAVLLLSIFYCEGVLAAGLYPDAHYNVARTSLWGQEKGLPGFLFRQQNYQYETVKKEITKPRLSISNHSSLSGLLKEQARPGYTGSTAYIPFQLHAAAEKRSITENTARPPIGGPSQPEMSAFQSVNNTNMVDLFSGDFSYNIPLMDVGGYPLNIAYRSGISMDQEASWVGLGWNINPGTITRNMRGLPDDFNGAADTVKKTSHVKENKTIGVTGGADAEVFGLPITVGASLGVFHNNYKGWGIENGLNASINAGAKNTGSLSGGLSITNNSQEGLTLAPSLTIHLDMNGANEKSGTSAGLTIGSSYNSRSGLKSLQVSGGLRQYGSDAKNQQSTAIISGLIPSGVISFATPSCTPTITLPFTSNQYSFTAKIGTENEGFHPSFFVSGYVSKQRIDLKDTSLVLPSYGYLNYQGANNNREALLDFNREKEIPYRENPAIPNIAIPNYTYDVFSITGEGTGGMFRAYRGDIGFVYDHAMQTKDESGRASVDVGGGDIFHGGTDLNVNRASTQNGPWLDENLLKNSIAFCSSSKTFEASYFRNPGEMSINSKIFYNAIGDDDVVTVNLYQDSIKSSVINASNFLNRYHNKKLVAPLPLNARLAVKNQRDKRTQVITYLTAKEASTAGVEKYINNYALNTFSLQNCHNYITDNTSGKGTGLTGRYYGDVSFSRFLFQRIDTTINFPSASSFNVYDSTQSHPFFDPTQKRYENFSISWTGRMLAPVTGTYAIATSDDDGVELWLNDSLVINNWIQTPAHFPYNMVNHVNLVAGEFYSIKLKYYQGPENASLKLFWSYGGKDFSVIPKAFLYPLPAPDADTLQNLTIEKRVNQYRKPNHISEIDVLNADGRRYIYGIPAYNFKQKEATFSVDYRKGNTTTGLTGYTDGVDNTAGNTQGKDNYYTKEEIPSYAHSFLLTSILSPDYVDLKGDGVTDDDPGDAIHFKYTKIGSITHPYGWRAPYVKDSVTYNEGLKTDNRDGKGSYVYGEKELWYLNSIESKNMMATFTVENRLDLAGISEAGVKTTDHYAKRLKQIDLYNKADFLKNGVKARPVKTVHFEYSYELCLGVNQPFTDSSGKLTLKKIWFTYNGNNKGKLNPYIFTYHANNPSYHVNAYDKWGNYKQALQNPGSVTGNLVTNGDYPYSIQDSATAAYNAAAWTLTQVKLPSGGIIKVDYESDDYAYVQNKRAGQMFQLAGFASSSNPTSLTPYLYTATGGENLYVFATVPDILTSVSQVYTKYLEGITKLYFKLAVKMPADQYGSGIEYVPCYAGIDSYGFVPGTNRIWIKIKGTGKSGEADGPYSPLAEAAIQFLRLNLPSKAYPGSEVGDDLDLMGAVKTIASMAGNIINAFSSFHNIARGKSWSNQADLTRTLVRLDNPNYKKIGGGLRVKRLVTYDNWNAMTHQQESVYGRTYDYTTVKEVNGVPTRISSGVASYEPMIGGDENPFRIPIEYAEQVAPFAPTTMGYTEEPLGECFFPSASIGYSKVTVRSINTNNSKSANGYEETKFYTAYDFPTLTDRSLLDNDTKKRYKPGLANFLRIDARYYLALSQGFKVELNDMHGKMRSQSTYSETDANNPISYTENFYKVDDQAAEFKHLSNTVKAMDPTGNIDTTSVIGKDIELMADMREQVSKSQGINVSINADVIPFPFIPPVLVIPSAIALPQNEENRFRSVAISKVIQRHGILDSVIHIEKGSKISTRNLLYDSETGDVLLTRTQNEFNDPIYNFSYPSHWAYDGMGEAYKNINTVFDHIFIKGGKITAGLPSADSTWFTGGDELLINSKVKTGAGVNACQDAFATFANPAMLWAVDTSLGKGKAQGIYFIDKQGTPFEGNDISLKITRSGRRNINTSVGSVSTLVNPLVFDPASQNYALVLNSGSKVISTAATECKQMWKSGVTVNTCVPVCPTGGILSNDKTTCLIKQPVIITVDTIGSRNDTAKSFEAKLYQKVYGNDGTTIYSSVDTSNPTTQKYRIDDDHDFWLNGDTANVGPLNRCGIWTSALQYPDSTSFDEKGNPYINHRPVNQWVGYTTEQYFPYTGTYYIGMAGDNGVRLYIDDSLFREDNGSGSPQKGFSQWHIYPYTCNAGIHTLHVQGINNGGPALFGVEIYGNTPEEIERATSYDSLNIIFTTGGGVDSILPVMLTNTRYSCPEGYDLDSTGGIYTCDKHIIPIITINSQVAGISGNWRPYKNYTYFGNRAQTDPLQSTNLRRDGAFKDFAPFWTFSNGGLQPSYDTTRWVWNSEVTLFNIKGFELENKDPLGRYTGGLYGYNNTLPTAVVQNARYAETSFEGFEDYDFAVVPCDTVCTYDRFFGFSAFTNKITAAEKHSGQYSLGLKAGESVTVNAFIKAVADTTQPAFAYTSQWDGCVYNTLLKTIQVDSCSALPQFAPLAGKKMVFSAWVKEGRDCKCTGYTGNQVQVDIINSTGTVSSGFFTPTGAIIDGWQRYEVILDIPADATSLYVTLKATDTASVYFDDIRIHPFSANMKSFVYNPVNLRLMAELDENNYATFYEYDDDGTLIRVKKETQRGVKTIKETRSALLKE